MTYIYLVENCFKDPNSIYIGKTKIKGSRKNHHKRNFGKDIIFTTIDYVNSDEKEIWEPLESYWINQFKVWGFKVQNKNEGGGGCVKASEAMKKKISNSNKGKKRSPEHIEKYKGPKTKEHCYNLSIAKKGKPSSKKGKKTGPNLKLKGRKSYHKEDTGKKISEAKKGKQVNGLKILDIKNNIIFNSKVECAKFHGFNINKMRKLVDENKYFIKIKNGKEF